MARISLASDWKTPVTIRSLGGSCTTRRATGNICVAKKRALPVCLLCLVIGSAVLPAQRHQDFITPTPLAEGATLVVGFLGGRESWDNQHRGVRKLALKLRAMRLPGVHVETVENTKRPVALALVRSAFDRDRNGRLDDRERAS